MKSILNNKKLGGIMLLISMAFFLWVSIFGLIYHMNGMGVNTNKNNCLFNNQTTECSMGFREHITIWHGVFTIMPQNILNLIDAIILLISLTIIITFYRNNLSILSRRITSRFKLYLKEHPQIKLFNNLEEIFSSGILNTKIYKTVTI